MIRHSLSHISIAAAVVGVTNDVAGAMCRPNRFTIGLRNIVCWRVCERTIELYKEIITSAKEVMFLPDFVCLSVCLSVCLCVSKITHKVMGGSF